MTLVLLALNFNLVTHVCPVVRCKIIDNQTDRQVRYFFFLMTFLDM